MRWANGDRDVMVKNLRKGTNDSQLRAKLEKVGKLNICRVALNPTTGKPRTYGYVQFTSPVDAQRAVAVSQRDKTW